MNPLTATGSQISWRGRAANIVDAAIGQALVSIEAASRNLSSSTAASSPKDRANAYDDILIASQDAVDATRRAIEELEKEGVAEGDAVLADIKRDEGPALIRALAAAGVDIHEARWVGTDLEAIFFTETGAVQTPETIHAG